MLDSLKFVKGAVAKKDFVPALRHFKIQNGRITGYNGYIALSSPIDLDLDVYPEAEPFYKAINACNDTVKMHLTPTGKLSIRAGKFRSLVNCLSDPGTYPDLFPEGEETACPQELAEAFQTLAPFIGVDASRPWAMGLLLKGNIAMATNNVVIIQYWMPVGIPYELAIPRRCVNEILRLRESPETFMVNDHSISLNFSGDRWIRSQLQDKTWPDIGKVLDGGSNPLPIPEGLFEALETIKPFATKEERVYLGENVISTHPLDVGEGTTIEVEGLNGTGCFNVVQLLNVVGLATSIDFTMYPKPVHWFSPKCRGAIVGMRL